MLDDIVPVFRACLPAVDSWSLRLVEEHTQAFSVRQGILQPPYTGTSCGAFIELRNGSGTGYAATSNLTAGGLREAVNRAWVWAGFATARSLVAAGERAHLRSRGSYRTPVAQPWESLTQADKIVLLQDACTALKIDERIVDWMSWMQYRRTRSLLITSDDGRIDQLFEYIAPGLSAVANQGTETQQRTGAGAGSGSQGGFEQLARVGFPETANRIAEEALALLQAPECPSGSMDLLLMPDQMVLQIHESIGHPLELDRILGDERNYAGTSFVTLDMFGQYQYGSELLNVTFDPTRPEQFASYGYDDEGTAAERTHIIRRGMLERPLGGATSQVRARLPGVATARASHWNRPPIDRMANLNLEPGESSLDDLVDSVERGVLMETNRSWSIDDSRNKFQFGCELGRIIKNGELKGLVRNPNYRGKSADFWRSLSGVGDAKTLAVLGTPNCGKGEPNQMIHVGHASPACVFRNVQVFGGAG